MALIYKYKDSFNGEILSEKDVRHIQLTIDDRTWRLDLSDESINSFWQAINPFIENEVAEEAPATVEPEEAEEELTITPEVREQLRAFAEKNDMGTVGVRGRIRQEIIDAWVDAGKPEA